MRNLREMSRSELVEIPISTLAYIGDAVYELAVRRHLLEKAKPCSGKLYVAALDYVSCEAQAKALEAVEDTLAEDEEALCRRARNHSPRSMPRNAELRDYRQATALEALCGWLWLAGEEERLEEVIFALFKVIEEDSHE